jgi:hypothetical protein
VRPAERSEENHKTKQQDSLENNEHLEAAHSVQQQQQQQQQPQPSNRKQPKMSVSSSSSTATTSSPVLEAYLNDLKKVIEWLAASESVLINQSDIGNDVNLVKQQFQTHEVGPT